MTCQVRVCYYLRLSKFCLVDNKMSKNPVDFQWRWYKNLIFIICKSSEVFRNTRKILLIIFFVVAVQLCLRIVCVSWSLWSRNCFLRKQSEKEQCTPCGPSRWSDTVPHLSVQAMGKYYGSHTQVCDVSEGWEGNESLSLQLWSHLWREAWNTWCY